MLLRRRAALVRQVDVGVLVGDEAVAVLHHGAGGRLEAVGHVLVAEGAVAADDRRGGVLDHRGQRGDAERDEHGK